MNEFKSCRLVETIAEQGEDMQGYVTEIILTLESVVDSLDSDIRPMVDFSSGGRDIFKSTPNLKDAVNKPIKDANNKDRLHPLPPVPTIESPVSGHNYHVSAPATGAGPFPARYPYDRCVSYNPSASRTAHKTNSSSPYPVTGQHHHIRGRSSTDSEGVGRGGGHAASSAAAIAAASAGSPGASSSLSRSRSAQSLKLQDQVCTFSRKLIQLSSVEFITQRSSKK